MKLKVLVMTFLVLGCGSALFAETMAEKSPVDIVLVDDFNTVDVELQTITIAEDSFMKITDQGSLPLEHAESMTQVKSVSKTAKTLTRKDTKSLQHKARDGL